MHSVPHSPDYSFPQWTRWWGNFFSDLWRNKNPANAIKLSRCNLSNFLHFLKSINIWLWKRKVNCSVMELISNKIPSLTTPRSHHGIYCLVVYRNYCIYWHDMTNVPLMSVAVLIYSPSPQCNYSNIERFVLLHPLTIMWPKRRLPPPTEWIAPSLAISIFLMHRLWHIEPWIVARSTHLLKSFRVWYLGQVRFVKLNQDKTSFLSTPTRLIRATVKSSYLM